jgi:hypothetical protein
VSKFSERLDLTLRENGRLKKDLSAHLGLSHSVVSGWGAQHSRPSLPQIVKAAEYLGVGPAWLAFGIGPQGGFGPEEERMLKLWDLLNPGQRVCIRQVMRHFAGPLPGEVSLDDPRVQRIFEMAAQSIDGLAADDVSEQSTATSVSRPETTPPSPGVRRKS